MPTMGHFFRLPRELRDRIYDLALLNQRLVFSHSNIELWVSYTQLGDVYEFYKRGDLCWLLTCRQILSEGLDHPSVDVRNADQEMVVAV